MSRFDRVLSPQIQYTVMAEVARTLSASWIYAEEKTL